MGIRKFKSRLMNKFGEEILWILIYTENFSFKLNSLWNDTLYIYASDENAL